jgi:hypothetical protein
MLSSGRLAAAKAFVDHWLHIAMNERQFREIWTAGFGMFRPAAHLVKLTLCRRAP